MIELEILLKDLGKLYTQEKGLRNKILLESAISSIKEYEKAVLSQQETAVFSERRE